MLIISLFKDSFHSLQSPLGSGANFRNVKIILHYFLIPIVGPIHFIGIRIDKLDIDYLKLYKNIGESTVIDIAIISLNSIGYGIENLP